MNQTQLLYWLRGYVELHVGAPTAEQWDKIRQEIMSAIDTPQVPTVIRQGDCGCGGNKAPH